MSMHKNKGIVSRFLAVTILFLVPRGKTLLPDNAQENSSQAAVQNLSMLTTAFTYQGQLTENSTLADGLYDFEFKLYDAASDGGLYGSVVVTRTATLNGVQALDFSNGYAPNQSDTFISLRATDGFTGTLASVEINGLEQGFEYEISYANDQLVLVALNDGVALHTLFLPLPLRLNQQRPFW